MSAYQTVYKVQVRTFNVLRELLQLPDCDLVTAGNHPLMHFRVLPKHRTAYGLALRKRVADIVRAARRDR